MREIQIPAETDESDRYGDNDGPKDFAVDGDRLYYTIWEPWTRTHLEGLTLPSGSPKQVHGGEGLSGASANDGRVLLFVASDEESIPGWDDVEMKRYTSEFDWNELPAIAWLPVVAVLALLGVARAGATHERY